MNFSDVKQCQKWLDDHKGMQLTSQQRSVQRRCAQKVRSSEPVVANTAALDKAVAASQAELAADQATVDAEEAASASDTTPRSPSEMDSNQDL